MRLLKELYIAYKVKRIKKSYNIAFRNGHAWITYNGAYVVPCKDEWTIDELGLEIERIITNSTNAYLNNGKELV